MKRILSLFLAILMVLSLAACGDAPVVQYPSPVQSPANSASNKNTATTPAEETGLPTETGSTSEELIPDEDEVYEFVIGLPTNAKILSFEDNALTHWIEETCNVELSFLEYAGGTDVSTQISTAIAARQELPDILYGVSLNANAISSYGKDGYFVDLTPYYDDKEGASATFWTRMENEMTQDQQERVLRTITDGDTGKIYGVPTVETSTIDKRKYQPWINQVWLDELGLEMPTDIDSLYTVLKTFKEKDPAGNGCTIPLFGSEKVGTSASIVQWIVNMFIYFHPDHRWQDYTGNDGVLEFVYTQDAFRDALKFLNKLYKEGLVTSMLYTASSSDMKGIITPASKQAMCGIFCGHLSIHCTPGNETMYEYVPMPLWGYAVEGEISCSLKTFITESCPVEARDKAFEILMTLWSWEGSMRVRYGEFGENWDYPDEGALSDMGYAAEYKLISDPLVLQNTAHWGTIASCFNVFAEGETAQADPNTDEWTMKKSALHGESRKIFDEAVANYNPAYTTPTLVYTTEEKDQVEMIQTNINSLVSKKMLAFITGIGADINNDADWNAFQQEMKDLGLEEYAKVVQTAYARQF